MTSNGGSAFGRKEQSDGAEGKHIITYSVLRAITGSFLAAAEAGIRPDTRVSATLTQTIIIACHMGSAARPEMPVSGVRIRLIIPCNR